MKTLEELKAIREKMQREIGELPADAKMTRVVVGLGTCGIASGARPVLDLLAEEVKKRHLDNIKVTQTGCIGLCQYEPIVEVYEPGKPKVSYVLVNEDKAKDILEQHLIGGKIAEKYMIFAEEE